VAAILASCPRSTRRAAYAKHTGTLELTRLVADRPDLVDELKEAWLAGYRRLLARSGGFRP